jgi:hypothetical protein
MTSSIGKQPIPVPNDLIPSPRTLRARAEADAGRTVPVAEVRRWVESWDTEREELPPVPRTRD